jgi:Fic family protein
VKDLASRSRRKYRDTIEMLIEMGLELYNSEIRIFEFEKRAQKQILVAMRGATQGENFDKIITSEFNDIGLPPKK